MARVLEKLGFVANGIVARRQSCERAVEAPARMMRLLLRENRVAGHESLAA